MQSEFQIEELVHQTEFLVVYRATTRDGIPLALVRLKYENDLLANLEGEIFENALEQLNQVPCRQENQSQRLGQSKHWQ